MKCFERKKVLYLIKSFQTIDEKLHHESFLIRFLDFLYWSFLYSIENNYKKTWKVDNNLMDIEKMYDFLSELRFEDDGATIPTNLK